MPVVTAPGNRPTKPRPSLTLRAWRRGAAIAAGAVALLALLPLGPAPAHAEQPGVEYRLSGGTWSAAPPALFDSTWSPVPGSSRTSTLEIRVNRPETTVVAVFVGGLAAGTPELARAATLSSGDTALPFEATAACTQLAPQTVRRSGEVVRVPLTLAVSPDLVAGQRTSLNFELRVSLSDTGPTLLPNGCPIDPEIVRAFPAATPVDPLATTGSSGRDAGWIGLLALGAAGAGLTALGIASARRKRA